MSIWHPLYFSVNPQGSEITTRAHGLDISKYDLYFHPDVATAQLDFVIQRVSYRLTRDEGFANLIDGVMQIPIRGGYHYLNTDTAWKLQADKYLSYVSGLPYHFHACDFEGAFNVLSLDYAYWAWQWIHYVQDRTGKPVFLYTSPSLYSRWIFPSQARFGINWNTVPLWTAQWFWTPNANGTPSTPTGRTAPWKLWQYTDKGNGPLFGVSRPTACDLNVFNGTRADMARYLNITVPPRETPPEVEAMWKGRTNTAAKLWREPGVGQIDTIPSGTDVTGDAPLGEYVYLRTPKAGYTKKLWLSNYALVPVEPPPPPPPPEEPTITIKHTIRIYSNGSYAVDDGPVIP